MKISYKKRSGFSLIELLVAMVAGLIVIGAVLAFTLSSVSSNADYIASTRLSQELRNTMDYLSNELRRAGYDEGAASYVALPAGNTSASPFSRLSVVGSPTCVLYAYDRNSTPDDSSDDATTDRAGIVDLAGGEIRGIRIANADTNGDGTADAGVIEIAESAAGLTPACNGAAVDYTTYPSACSAGGWCALTDPTILNIQSFTMTSNNVGLTATNGQIQLRDFTALIRGNILSDPTVVRGVESRIKIRTDCLRAIVKPNPCDTACAAALVVAATAQCNASPTGS
ncbi:MAG: prepilin-type N-terminal cleavage/methylation domain-containing protein [Arenimonas sp.]